jgi:hypothetical protein
LFDFPNLLVVAVELFSAQVVQPMEVLPGLGELIDHLARPHRRFADFD